MLTLLQANQLIEAALTKGSEQKFRPLTVAVLDAGGHLVALQRQDETSILRPQIAVAKAWGSLALGIGGRSLAERAQSHSAFIAAVSDISGGRMAPVPGGVLLLDQDEKTIGAIGISGDLPDNDEACALAAIEVVGLKART